MHDHYPKRLVVLIVLVLAILAGSLYLFAKPAPSAPVPPVPAPNPPQAASASSTQPKIIWSQNQIEVILAPTESASSDLTFNSSLNLQNVVIEAVPGIAGFVNVQPNSFANVSAGSLNVVHVSISIPSSTALGTYEGTIHVRIGSSTLPQTLKVAANVWHRYANPQFGVSLLIPPEMIAETDSDYQGSIIYIHDVGEEFPNGIAFRRHTRDLATVLSDITATLRVASQKQLTANGQTWTIYDFVDDSGGPEFVDAFTTVNGVVYQVGGKALSVSSVLHDFLTTIVFN